MDSEGSDSAVPLARPLTKKPHPKMAERARLAQAVSDSGRRDAAAWLALLRHDYADARAAGTRDAWARLLSALRGVSALPPEQRRTEAYALIQIDEARVRMCVGCPVAARSLAVAAGGSTRCTHAHDRRRCPPTPTPPAALCSHLNSDDTRAFLKAARTIPQGRNSWTLWRCSIIYEARLGACARAAARSRAQCTRGLSVPP